MPFHVELKMKFWIVFSKSGQYVYILFEARICVWIFLFYLFYFLSCMLYIWILSKSNIALSMNIILSIYWCTYALQFNNKIYICVTDLHVFCIPAGGCLREQRITEWQAMAKLARDKRGSETWKNARHVHTPCHLKVCIYSYTSPFYYSRAIDLNFHIINGTITLFLNE